VPEPLARALRPPRQVAIDDALDRINGAKWDMTNRLASQQNYARYFHQYCALMRGTRYFTDWTAWVFTVSPATGLSVVATGGISLTEPLLRDPAASNMAAQLANGQQVRVSGRFIGHRGRGVCESGRYGSGDRPRPNRAETVRFTKIAPLS
jgi:hypothetical protein